MNRFDKYVEDVVRSKPVIIKTAFIPKFKKVKALSYILISRREFLRKFFLLAQELEEGCGEEIIGVKVNPSFEDVRNALITIEENNFIMRNI